MRSIVSGGVRVGSDVMARWWPALIIVIPLVGVTLVVGSINDVLNRTMTDLLITVILVVGLYVFIGNSGVYSFGHMSFMAIGAYCTALLTIPTALKHVLLPDLPRVVGSAELPTTVAILVGAIAAAALAAVLAVPLMRLSGIAAGIATLAVLVIVYQVLVNASSITGGLASIAGMPVDVDVLGTVGWAALSIVVAFWFKESSMGLRLRASREDLVAARAVGINVDLERGIAFVLSASIVAIAGGLYGHSLGEFNPDAFYLAATFTPIAMLVVGGATTLSGAVVGSALLFTLSEAFRQLSEGVNLAGLNISMPLGSGDLTLAAVMLAVLLFRPEGITGGREIVWPFRSKDTNLSIRSVGNVRLPAAKSTEREE